MKKSDFREITPEMIHFAKTLKSNGGICGLKCNNCPFSDANSYNSSDCTEKYATPDYNFGDIAYLKDKLLEKSAKKFLKLVEKDVKTPLQIKDYLKMQEELNKIILKKNGKKYYKDLLTQTILACMVELGEYANETRCFKHWSEKGASEKNIRLEEFVDVLHFIWNIALIDGFTAEDIEMAYKQKYQENIRRQKEGY